MALVAMLGLLFSAPALAVKICFGERESVESLLGTPIVTADGTRLWVGMKLTTSCFILPYNQREDGYVFAFGGRDDRYLPFPDDEEVARLQSTGMLPTPLPPWEPGLLHLVFRAYLLWVVLLAIVLPAAARKVFGESR